MGRIPTLSLVTPEQEEIEQLRHGLRILVTRPLICGARSSGAVTLGPKWACWWPHKMTRDEAVIELLRSTSQNCNRKVRDIALDVMEQGELPQYAHGLPQTEAGRSTA
jgi:hypothetical protein